MAIKLKHITLYVLLWVLTTASAFYVGTYFPNKKTIRNIEDKITVVDMWKEMGLRCLRVTGA